METTKRIKDLVRHGPFTAQPGEAWVDAGLAAEREAELLDYIQEMVCQFSTIADDGLYDSMCISVLEDAMHLLAACGRMVIEQKHGRRVLARVV